jgi:hypothetical protein
VLEFTRLLLHVRRNAANGTSITIHCRLITRRVARHVTRFEDTTRSGKNSIQSTCAISCDPNSNAEHLFMSHDGETAAARP